MLTIEPVPRDLLRAWFGKVYQIHSDQPKCDMATAFSNLPPGHHCEPRGAQRMRPCCPRGWLRVFTVLRGLFPFAVSFGGLVPGNWMLGPACGYLASLPSGLCIVLPFF